MGLIFALEIIGPASEATTDEEKNSVKLGTAQQTP